MNVRKQIVKGWMIVLGLGGKGRGKKYAFIMYIWQNKCVQCFFVKLHSELANPTELKLDGVGVYFVSPPSQVTSNDNNN